MKNLLKTNRLLGAAFAGALLLGAAAGAQAGTAAPSVLMTPGQCKPTMFADLHPYSVYVDVTQPLPKTINVQGHGGPIVILLVRPWPWVGAAVTAEATTTDGNAAPLFTLVNKQVTSAPLCHYIVAQWLVARAGTGEIAVTTTPVVPNAQPQVVTIPVVTK